MHILVSSPPTLAPSEIMRRLKGRTASQLFKEFFVFEKTVLGPTFLGARLFLCNRGTVNGRNDQKLFRTSF
ncbi:transposase [Photorhabdus sp. SF281]|uniref:transposase n=1 Tax=Photorhabdus sp. SF281 TaxID=3459527 RepID=UPI004044FE78